MDIVTILIRSLISFVLLLFLARLMGKKQMSQLTFFDYVTGITIGNITASMSIDKNTPLLTGAVSLIAWTLFTITISLINLKSTTFRVVVDGQPTILIRNGKILGHALKSAKMNLDDLTMLLRRKNAFSISEVDYAILEADGQLSVLPKQNAQLATKEDVGKVTVSPRSFLPCGIISEGKLNHRNLSEIGISPDWVYDELNHRNIPLETIFFGEIQRDGTLYIDQIGVHKVPN